MPGFPSGSQRGEQQDQQARWGRRTTTPFADNDRRAVPRRRVAGLIFERQESKFRRIDRAVAGQESIRVRIEQLDQQVIVAAGITRHQFRDDDVFVVLRCAGYREYLGGSVLGPRATFQAQVKNRINVGKQVVGVGIEKQVDAVEVAVPVMVVEQHDVSCIKPEFGVG